VLVKTGKETELHRLLARLAQLSIWVTDGKHTAQVAAQPMFHSGIWPLVETFRGAHVVEGANPFTVLFVDPLAQARPP